MTTIKQLDATSEGASDSAREPRRHRRRSAEQGTAIDIRAALEAPVRVKQNGASVPMHPYEAMLRGHLRKSLVDKSIASIKFVLTQAEKHTLIETSPQLRRSGVVVIPKDLPEEAQDAIFGEETSDLDAVSDMRRIVGILFRHLSIEAVVRMFNGQRNKTDKR